MTKERTWPELGDELGRKAVELMEDRLHKHMVEGVLSEREIWLIADAISEVIQGLAKPQIFEVIYKIRQEADKDAK